MSASSHDAIHGPGKPLKFTAPELDAPDPTEDIADEATSELAAGPERARPAPREDAAELRAPAAGDVLRDRYVLEAQIGGGGTAAIFQALDRRRDDGTAGGPRVAVKLLRPDRSSDPHSIARLQREFRQTQDAAHPGVVRFLDLDCDRGSWFIVMELLAGESLAARLRRAAPVGLPRPQALAIAAAVAEALAHAHGRDIVHGDVKPANVFVTDTGEPRLLDFGVAPSPGEPPEPVAATRSYASPEVQAGAAAEKRDDVFSLACLACETLAGVHPFGRGGAKAATGSDAPAQRPPALDDATWRVLARALDRRRERRPDMGELARTLREAAEPAKPRLQAPAARVAAPAPAPAPARVPAPGQPAPARRPGLAAGACMAAVLALVLGILIGRLDDEARPAPVRVASPIEVAKAPPDPPAAAATAADTVTERGTTTVAADPAVTEPVPSPAPTGAVSFELSSMAVSNRAVVAAIPLRHVTVGGAERAARVNWRIIEGSAVPGRDYGGPESGVESFAAGHRFRILYVPVVANPATDRDRTFVVELTGGSPGVQLGPTPRVAVTITGDP